MVSRKLIDLNDSIEFILAHQHILEIAYVATQATACYLLYLLIRYRRV